MAAQPDVLDTQTGTGATDWTGYRAPAVTPQNTCTIRMKSGATYVVAHSRAEVLKRLDTYAVAPVSPLWIAFDLPGRPSPGIVLNGLNIDVGRTA